MNESIPSAAGSYLLAIYLSEDQTPAVETLGQIELREGYIVYAGSARSPGGLRSCLTHHRTPSNNPHWHIDYLSSAGVITEIWWTVSEQRLECQLAEHLPDLPPRRSTH